MLKYNGIAADGNEKIINVNSEESQCLKSQLMYHAETVNIATMVSLMRKLFWEKTLSNKIPIVQNIG